MNDEAKKLAELTPKIMNAFHDLGRQHPSHEKLTMRQYQALIILHVSRTLTVTQLCEKLSLAASTGTELVNRMLSLGYIQKGLEMKDLRQVPLSMAPKGLELIQNRQAALTEMFARFLAPLEADDKEKFVHGFEQIWKIIEKYHTNQP